ncbi:DUF3368 domain-containing protein [Salibacterium halotolerans]|uniref:Predicted nucleic acid-binding protein, contains PIN domain n=1 Tax=Salibacterium halotolerans TaxID=1884432 RepID=A0A1I5L464_9BACI|nr:DUF3368 domain-containing protein [Salibacterium halotolerans]SFO91952.1 Predicted nucleic acid-binding protein, contains PIN domain [Salibacterium halotolerans]
MTKVLVNSTPIIGLSMIGKLSLLTDLFDDVLVPEAVFYEIIHDHTSKSHGKQELLEFIDKGTFQLYRVENSPMVQKLYGKLHEGELEVIVGAKELNVSYVIIDEKAARTLSKTFMLTPIGTLGILILAKKKGKIEAIKPILDELKEYNFHVSKSLYYKVLHQAGELR